MGSLRNMMRQSSGSRRGSQKVGSKRKIDMESFRRSMDVSQLPPAIILPFSCCASCQGFWSHESGDFLFCTTHVQTELQ